MTGTIPRAPMPSPDSWRAQLERSRGSDSRSADAWNDVRRQFRDVTAQTRLLLKRPLEFPVLRQLADRGLQLSQIAFEELNAAGRNAPAAAPAAVLELLDDNRQLLDAIGAQQQLIADIHAAAEPMHVWAEAAVHGELTSPEHWLDWTEELRRSVRQDAHAALLPMAGVRLDESLSRAGWNRPGWFAQALCSARLAAALGDHLLEGDPNGPLWLTAAALMQDIGLWDMVSNSKRSRRSQAYRLQQHPAFGAAVLSIVPQCPTEIVLLVGTHEERIDGSGEPQRLSGYSLSRRSQLLGLIARVCELANSPRCHAEAQSHGETLEFAVGLHVWRDVRRGAFREELARAALEVLEPELSGCIAGAFAERAHLFVDREHHVPEPHRDVRAAQQSEEVVSPPMYLRRQRSGAARWTYSTPLAGAER